MKYVLMFTSRPDLDAAVEPARAKEVYTAVFHWFNEQGEAGNIADSGAELHPVTSATTVKSGENGDVVVVDGPFSEAKEVIGGFSVIEAPDLDAAIAITKTWPLLQLPGVAVEIRPMVVDYAEFQ